MFILFIVERHEKSLKASGAADFRCFFICRIVLSGAFSKLLDKLVKTNDEKLEFSQTWEEELETC